MQNILFIGNSFTYFNDLPGMLRDLSEAADAEPAARLSTAGATEGGAFLRWFTDPRKAICHDLSALYPTRKWDAVVLQGQSFEPADDREAFVDSAKKLCALFGEEKIFFYSTWAYRRHSDKLRSTGLSYEELLQRLTDGYKDAAQATGGTCVPVGKAFALAGERCPEIDLLNKEDDYHPAPTGTYLAACVFYRALTGAPLPAAFVPEGVTGEQAALLRKVVREVF